jgi:hypothetical protein
MKLSEPSLEELLSSFQGMSSMELDLLSNVCMIPTNLKYLATQSKMWHFVKSIILLCYQQHLFVVRKFCMSINAVFNLICSFMLFRKHEVSIK